MRKDKLNEIGKQEMNYASRYLGGSTYGAGTSPSYDGLLWTCRAVIISEEGSEMETEDIRFRGRGVNDEIHGRDRPEAANWLEGEETGRQLGWGRMTGLGRGGELRMGERAIRRAGRAADGRAGRGAVLGGEKAGGWLESGGLKGRRGGSCSLERARDGGAEGRRTSGLRQRPL